MGESEAPERRIIFSLFSAALVLRLAYLLEMSSGPYFVSPQLDELNFDLWGRRIAFESFWGHSIFPRGPLYPYFLGILYRIFGHDYFLPRLAQSILGALAASLLYLIGKRTFGRPSAVLGGALAVAFPTLIFFGGELLITSIFLPLSLLTLWLFLRWSEEPRRAGRLAAAGAVCGLSALARPNMLLVAPFFALWSAWVAWRAGLSWRGNFAGLVLLTASVVAVILPVTVRNWVVGRDFVLISSQGGINFYVGNNAAATGFTSATPKQFRYWTEYEDSVDLFARRQAEIETDRGAAEGRGMKPSEISRYWSRKAWNWIASHPADAARLALKKALLFWSAVEIKDNKSISFAARFSRLLTVLLWILPFGLVAPLALVQMVRRRSSASQALLIGFVICYMMSVVPFFVYARYRMPVVPVLLLYAAHWVVEAAGEISRKRVRAVAIRLVLTGLFALLVWVDSYGARRVMRELRHEDYWVAGNGYMISGRYEKAAEYYHLAIEEKPDYADAWLNLGKTLIQAEDYEGAAEAISRLLAVDPDNTGGLSNAAVIAEKTGDPTRAEKLWRRALDIEPDNAPALLGLGDMLRVLGRLDEGEALLRRAFEIRPDDFEAAVGLALLFRARGDAGSFTLWAEKARALNPEQTDKRLREEAKLKVN